MLENYLSEHLKKLKGSIGIFYKNLTTGETVSVNEDRGFISASLIKLPVLAEAFHQIKTGAISSKDIVRLDDSDKLPYCGALSYMHSGLELTIEDLCNLMIILSDNTATNILIRYLGFDSINGFMKELGLANTTLGRLLFDMEADARGLKNIVSPKDVALLFELIWKGELVSTEASRQMLDILEKQQLNNKIPARLDEEITVAHKTGEDSGITHDAGIVYARQPFILCVLSEETDVFETNLFISNLAYHIYHDNN